MKIRLTSLIAAMLLTVSSYANDEYYTAWTKDEGKQVKVKISSPDRPITIRAGKAKIPIYVSPSYNIGGTIVSIDFLKNGKSVTGGYGMGGCLQGSPGSYYLILEDATMYWNALVDGQYKIIILPGMKY